MPATLEKLEAALRLLNECTTELKNSNLDDLWKRCDVAGGHVATIINDYTNPIKSPEIQKRLTQLIGSVAAIKTLPNLSWQQKDSLARISDTLYRLKD